MSLLKIKVNCLHTPLEMITVLIPNSFKKDKKEFLSNGQDRVLLCSTAVKQFMQPSETTRLRRKMKTRKDCDTSSLSISPGWTRPLKLKVTCESFLEKFMTLSSHSAAPLVTRDAEQDKEGGGGTYEQPGQWLSPGELSLLHPHTVSWFSKE